LWGYAEPVLTLPEGGQYSYYYTIDGFPDNKSHIWTFLIDECSLTVIDDTEPILVINGFIVTIPPPSDTKSCEKVFHLSSGVDGASDVPGD
jgi:hypothetical protein